MSLPAFDNFSDFPGAPLSANWTADLGNWQIQTNAAYADTNNLPNRARWTADSFTADHYAEAAISTVANGGGVAVRLSSGGNGYFVRFNAGLGEVYLQRLDSGVAATLQTITGLTIADFDRWKLSIIGTTLRVYQNSVQRGTNQTDATYATGAAGITMYGPAGSLLDSFAADNILPPYLLVAN